MSHYIIFGKDNCPHTKKAREDFLRQNKSFIYINVDANPHGLKKLLEYSNGQYVVPVIVEVDEGNVEIGYAPE
ncbi:MAG: glutaredoxin domain-containing protein [Nitrospinaceae bacterium]